MLSSSIEFLLNNELITINDANTNTTVLEYLRTLDTHNWNELMEKAQVSVDFNYELITTGGFRRPSNNNFFEELISYASN